MSDLRSALTETCFAGEVGAEFAHDLGVSLACQFLSRGAVVLLHEGGEGRGRPAALRESTEPAAQCTKHTQTSWCPGTSSGGRSCEG